MDLFERLLDGVRDFLKVDFAHHVEAVLWHGRWLPVNRLPCPKERCFLKAKWSWHFGEAKRSDRNFSRFPTPPPRSTCPVIPRSRVRSRLRMRVRCACRDTARERGKASR